MAGSVNKVILIGNLGKDPEVRHLENDVSVANFPIATSESYKDRSGQKVEQTEWHNIVVWRGLAKVAEKYLKKGSQVFIEGKIRTRSWQDKEGVTRYTTEVVADNLTMLGRSGEGNPAPGNTGGMESTSPQNNQVKETANETFSGDISEEDDLPF